VLTATNAVGSDTETKPSYITVHVPAPSAVFNADVVSGETPLSVVFTDASSNSPTSWSWNFGDGSTSTEQSPTHVYASSGVYTVVLTVINPTGSDTETKTNYINAVTDPTAAFSWGRSNVTTYYFVDQSLENPTSWSWEFGDGTTSAVQDPAHAYATQGNYTVNLTVSNLAGSDTISKFVNVSVQPTNLIEYVGPTWQYVEFNESKEFSYLTPYGILTSHWFINGVEYNYTGTNLSYTFDMPGRAYNISVWAETNEGNSSMLEYRVMCGREKATTHLVPANTTNYDNLINATMNMSTDGIMTSAFATYTDSIGRLAYVVLFVLPFMFVWFQTGKLTIPVTLAMIVGGVFIGFVPAQFTTFIILVIVMAYAAAFYKLSRGS
jgi:PKD repeat protein